MMAPDPNHRLRLQPDTSTDFTEPMLEQVRSIARPFLRQQDHYHNEIHAQRVAAFAELIHQEACARREERPDANLLIAAAWLHQFHDPNLDNLRAAMEKLSEIDEATKMDLYNAVVFCRPNAIDQLDDSTEEIQGKLWGAVTNRCKILARYLFDADAFDLIGPSGTVREYLCNKWIRKMTHVASLEATATTVDLFNGKLQTEAARKIAAPWHKVVLNWRRTLGQASECYSAKLLENNQRFCSSFEEVEDWLISHAASPYHSTTESTFSLLAADRTDPPPELLPS